MKTIYHFISSTPLVLIRRFILVTCLLVISIPMSSQDNLDELVSNVSERLNAPIQDSVKLWQDAHRALKLSAKKNDLRNLGLSYSNLAKWHSRSLTLDSTEYYLKKAQRLYTKARIFDLQAETHLALEDFYKQRAEYNKAMTEDFSALKLYEDLKDSTGVAMCYTRLCDLLYYQEKHGEGADYCQKAIDIQEKLNLPEDLALSHRYKADNFLILKRYDDALHEIEKAISVLKKAGKPDSEIASCYNTRGNIYKYMERYEDAFAEYSRCYQLALEVGKDRDLIPSLGNMGHIKRLQGKYEEALTYSLQTISIMEKTGDTRNLSENYMHASGSYAALGQYEDALKYEQLYSNEKIKHLEQSIGQLESELQIKYETAKKDETIVEQDVTINKQKQIQWMYFGIALLLGVIVFGMIFTIKNSRKKENALKKLNHSLEEKQNVIEESNAKLKHSLAELKETQKQLIQSEKMASLGELTAGIAHEIKNPLNFVNNFAEVTQELLDEMIEEIDKGDVKEAKLISQDIKQNLEKIHHHGSRADDIVMGMLRHSRSSSSDKEATDLNKLADEYLRLAYHGLRAKDKSFNATLVTEFDETIDKVKVFPQDLGRVILNLITNAFYACNERKKTTTDPEYKPAVTLKTERIKGPTGAVGAFVQILIQDNGNGIPQEVIDKIFQPFFTTKPTGEGTGLGLSMSYDIIQAHDGSLNVSSEVGEGTMFRIQIPYKL